MKESVLHKMITDWILETYPTAVFNTDASGIKLTIGQAVQLKKLRSSNAFPDISIYEKGSLGNALFLEVKKETPYKKDGSLKSNEHLYEQQQMHVSLKKRGYYACFVWTLEQAQNIIKEHLNHINVYNGE